MNFLNLHIVGLVAIAQCLKLAMCRVDVANESHLAPSFIASDSAIQNAGAKAGVVFAEMSSFQDNIVNGVADSMLSFLEAQGFNYENPDHMKQLVSFMESVVSEEPPKSKAAKFMDEMKKMALKTWHATKGTAKETAKQVILASLKGILKESLKDVIPVLEKVNEKAMRTLPLNLRIALAPIAHNMWRHFFEKTKIKLPEDFKIENFVCMALDKEKCDEVINKVKNTWIPAKQPKASIPEIDDFDLESVDV